MKYFPYGPIEVPRSGSLIANDNASLKRFWEAVEDLEEGLSEAVGCYIFSIRAAKGYRPWYVGLAEKQSFRKECFMSHKITHYDRAMNQRKGTPVLTFLPKLTGTEKWAKPSKNGHRDIRFLETMLIGTCVRRNAELLNIKGTALLREMTVPGLLNSPKGASYLSVREFKKVIGTNDA